MSLRPILGLDRRKAVEPARNMICTGLYVWIKTRGCKPQTWDSQNYEIIHGGMGFTSALKNSQENGWQRVSFGDFGGAINKYHLRIFKGMIEPHKNDRSLEMIYSIGFYHIIHIPFHYIYIILNRVETPTCFAANSWIIFIASRLSFHGY